MRSAPRALIAIAAAWLVVACSDVEDDRSGSRESPVEVTSGAQAPEPSRFCADVIPDQVFAGFGWRDAQAAGDVAGACERAQHGDQVRVELMPGSDADDLADRCESLGRGRGPVPEQDPDWLTADAALCIRGFPAGEVSGYVEGYLLTAHDEVIDLRIATAHTTTTTQYRAGVDALATAVAAADWSASS